MSCHLHTYDTCPVTYVWHTSCHLHTFTTRPVNYIRLAHVLHRCPERLAPAPKCYDNPIRCCVTTRCPSTAGPDTPQTQTCTKVWSATSVIEGITLTLSLSASVCLSVSLSLAHTHTNARARANTHKHTLACLLY